MKKLLTLLICLLALISCKENKNSVVLSDEDNAIATLQLYQNVSPELANSILNKKKYHSPGQELLNTIFYGHGTTRADQIGDINEGM